MVRARLIFKQMGGVVLVDELRTVFSLSIYVTVVRLRY